MAGETTATGKTKREGSGKNCAVIGCKNTSKRLRRWKLATCELHAPETHEYCPCVQPYRMHRFPGGSGAEAVAKRRRWVTNINRLDFKPSTYSTVCSLHFVERRPTQSNPYPTINLGHNANVHFEGQHYEQRRLGGKRNLRHGAVATVFGGESQQITLSGIRPVVPVPVPMPDLLPPNSVLHDHAYSATALPQRMHVVFPGADPETSKLTADEHLGADEGNTQEGTAEADSSTPHGTSAQLTKLREKIKMYQAIVHHLRRDKAILLNKKYRLEAGMLKMFSSDQIQVLSRGGTGGVQWSQETINKALRLRQMCGSNGYEFLLRHHYPLPSLRTLRRSQEQDGAGPLLDAVTGTSRATLLPREMFESGFHN